jgi:hypothetical protein
MPKNKRNARQILVIDTSKIAIISFGQIGNWPFDNSYKPASLSYDEVFEIDSIMRSCILDYNNNLSESLRAYHGIDFKKYDYKRQYVSIINSNGEKEVWINCFCDSFDMDWKKQILHVNDGGNCFFNLKVNLSTKKCYDIFVNGYA